MDVRCAKCGEPWDYYGINHGDVSFGEAQRFKAGEGCPCCNFGQYCPLCSGVGREGYHGYGVECTTCQDKGYVLAWSPRKSVRGFKVDTLYFGYEPNVRRMPEIDFESPRKIGKRTFPEKIGSHETADGWVDEWWVICPDCNADGNISVCPKCGGSGELIVDEDNDLEAAREEMDATDEDPMEVLIRRGMI